MRKATRVILPLLLVMLAIVSCASVRFVAAIGNYGTLINYVGIVRGASQRVVKLETNRTPSDALIDEIDGILEELQTGEGPRGLSRIRCSVCNDNVLLLNRQWEVVLRDIEAVRAGAENGQLLADSEVLFEIANDTVFSFVNYSTGQVRRLAALIGVMAFICIVCGAAVVYAYIKRYLALKKTNEALEDKAYRDELTGALNGDKFIMDAERIVKRHPDQKFAVLYIDLENFKYINDVFGYQYGDELLKKYAALMMVDLRENELFARNIADRFLALHAYARREELLARQRAVDRLLSEQAELLQNKFTLTVACGICCLEDVGEQLDIQALVNRANFAQKTVKQNPDNHYGFYNETIRERMIGELTLQSRMHTALENREFVAYLQPKVDPVSGRICCAEALARWNTPEHGLIQPGTFIPVLEKTRFISALDRYMFETICGWLRRRLDAGKTVLPISVNVSRLQFYKADFVETYVSLRERYQIPPGLIEIEFTETVAVENHDYMIRVIDDLHRGGFLCALDDFGAGYSSLGILKDLPVDVLKLDASFFSGSRDVARDQLILKGIISVIRELRIHTVAEGIEHREQVDFLKSVGCELVQGYYYFHPMPLADFEALLE